MRQDSPVYTFYSIIAASILALVFTHIWKIRGDEAMPVFMAAIALGLVFGELLERFRRGSKTR